MEKYEVQDKFTSGLPYSNKAQLRAMKGHNRKIKHHMLDAFSKWSTSNVMPHGKLTIELWISQSAINQLRLPQLHESHETQVSALADTDTQMCVADWQIAKRLVLRKNNLFAPALSVSVADNSSLELIGAHFLEIFDDSGEYTEQLVYFSNGVGKFYLSQEALKQLKVIPNNFPVVSSCEKATVTTISGSAQGRKVTRFTASSRPSFVSHHQTAHKVILSHRN